MTIWIWNTQGFDSIKTLTHRSLFSLTDYHGDIAGIKYKHTVAPQKHKHKWAAQSYPVLEKAGLLASAVSNAGLLPPKLTVGQGDMLFSRSKSN